MQPPRALPSQHDYAKHHKVGVLPPVRFYADMGKQGVATLGAFLETTQREVARTLVANGCDVICALHPRIALESTLLRSWESELRLEFSGKSDYFADVFMRKFVEG